VDRDDYVRKYPDHCTTCEGWGVIKEFSPIFSITECACFKEKTCPRCGTPHALDSAVRCQACGWDIDDEDRGLPGCTAA